MTTDRRDEPRWTREVASVGLYVDAEDRDLQRAASARSEADANVALPTSVSSAE